VDRIVRVEAPEAQAATDGPGLLQRQIPILPTGPTGRENPAQG
jgi:hypothetical protein